MRRDLLGVLLAGVLVAPGAAVAAVSDADFEADTTRNLINLCTVSADDERQDEAIHFCHGYLVGAYHYHVAAHSGPDRPPLVCLPDPPPARGDVIAQFVVWVGKHPQYLDDEAVETEFRFLIDTWPCEP